MAALPLSFVFGTPLRPTSASNQQPAGLTRSQDDLKDQLQVELRDAIFEPKPEVPVEDGVDLILDAFYAAPTFPSSCIEPVTSSTVSELVEALEACRNQAERAAYKPLAKLFNHILNHLPSGTAQFRFYVYDREMRGKVDGSGNQKPDLLALLSSIIAGDRVLWRDVVIAVEVKSDMKKATVQALTYTRSMLAIGDKWFAPALVFSHYSGEFRAVFATRFGVFMTPILDLRDAGQYDIAASMVARICAAVGTDGSTGLAGYDPNRYLDSDGKLCISLPISGGAQWFRLHDISHRTSLLGRATLVAAAEPVEKASTSTRAANSDSADASEQLIEYIDAVQSGFRPPVPVPRSSARIVLARSRAVASLRKIYTGVVGGLTPSSAAVAATKLSSRVPDRRPPPGAVTSSSSEGEDPVARSLAQRWADDIGQAVGPASPLPIKSTDYTIVKSSWQTLPKHNNEGKALALVQDFHGCPDFAGDLTVMHPLLPIANAVLGGNLTVSPLLNADNTRKDIFSRFEPRVHKLVICKRPGLPIYHLVARPKRLGHAVADVMIGLYSTHKAGLSHRDVTTGNMLGVPEALASTADSRKKTLEVLGQRFASEGLEGLLDELHAFVNDFEHAIDWKEAWRERSFARSGTPEFMSVQQLLVMVEARLRAHTVIDDLESCIWVTLYNVLHAYVRRHSEAEKVFYRAFATDDYDHLLGQKFRILNLSTRDKEKGSALGVTWAMWSRLFPIANEAQAKLGDLMAKYLHPEDQNEDERAQQGSSAAAAPAQMPASVGQESDDDGFPTALRDAVDRPSEPLPAPGRDDPENPMNTRGWASAQEKRLAEYHAELEHLTEDVFYKYMHALKDALELLPESDEEPEIA